MIQGPFPAVKRNQGEIARCEKEFAFPRWFAYTLLGGEVPMTKYQLLGGILGLCTGDALGVPVEFRSRAELRLDPVTDMIGQGVHKQPPGTWSDDSALALCLAESLCSGYNLADLSERFVRALYEGYWTPWGKMFDIGGTTKEAIHRLRKKPADPTTAGGRDEHSNGNGSLSRILPLAFTLDSLDPGERWLRVSQVSSLTHAHPRSILACALYTEVALRLLAKPELQGAYLGTCAHARKSFAENPELHHYRRIISGELASAPESTIKSTGYVVDTLEAALWCLLTETSYEGTVLKAVNLGDDSDTIAAIAGGLAGILHGYAAIPTRWLDRLARRAEIEELGTRLFRSLGGKTKG